MVLLHAIELHLLIGLLAGMVFKVRMVLLLLSFAFFEFVLLTIIHDSIAVEWALSNLTAVQAGYLVGVYGRAVVENFRVLISTN